MVLKVGIIEILHSSAIPEQETRHSNELKKILRKLHLTFAK